MIMEIINSLQANMDVVMITALAVIAGADKLFLIMIATIGNIRDAWRKTFPNNAE